MKQGRLQQLLSKIPNKSTRKPPADKSTPAASGTERLRGFNPMRSVGAKLFIIFFISIVTFVLTVGMISFSISQSIIKDKVAGYSSQMLDMAGQNLDVFYSSFEKLSLQIFSDSEVRSILTEISNTDKSSYEYFTLTNKLVEKMMPIGLSNSSIKGFSFFDGDGQQFNVYGDTGSQQKSETEWLNRVSEANGKPVWMQGGENSFSPNKDLFALGRQLVDPYTHKQLGILLMIVHTNELSKEVAKLSLGDGSRVLIMNENGKLIYSTNSAHEVGTDSPVQLTDEQRSVSNDSFEADGNMIAYSQSKITGWTLVGAIPVDLLVEDAGQIFNLSLLMSLIAMILAILIGLFIMRMFARPLVNLMGLMREGANGNMKVRANFKSKDEIGLLGRSFDMMMEEITGLVKQTNQSAREVLETANELSNASKTTSIAAREIAVATEQISGGAAGLANESERGSELTQHIGDRMKNVIDSNMQMGTSASEVHTSSEQGIQYMHHLIDKTQAADEMVRSMVEKVDQLKESTQSIRKILDVLNKMTKQTNILSLNATIEAARAGEAGKGFRVVADEINQLAGQSRQSIDVVGEITETIQQGIDETVEVLASAYPIFQEQLNSVKDASTIFSKVQEDMNGFIQQLSTVSDSIAQLDESQNVLSAAMMNVSSVAEESLATSEEVASLTSEQLTISENLVKLSEKLENLSRSLQDSLSKFQV